MPWLSLALQLAAQPARTFPLQPVLPPAPCKVERVVDEIVVCGVRDEERYRLRPIDDARFTQRTKAETGVAGDMRAAAEVERAELAPGVVSNRMMIRLKLPF